MAQAPEFKYAPMFQVGEDTTEYYHLTSEHVSLGNFEGKEILKVTPEALTMLIERAFTDVNFMLRRSHNECVAKILKDPESSDNDKYVALTMLRNAEVSAKGVLPICQDTGTAIIHGEKGQRVWSDFSDEEAISRGVYNTYTKNALRYSQNAPLTLYKESIHAATFLLRSISKPQKVKNIASFALLRAAALPTSLISSRRQKLS